MLRERGGPHEGYKTIIIWPVAGPNRSDRSRIGTPFSTRHARTTQNSTPWNRRARTRQRGVP